MKKRILSIVLAIAMAATLAPVSGLVSSKEAKAATVNPAASVIGTNGVTFRANLAADSSDLVLPADGGAYANGIELVGDTYHVSLMEGLKAATKLTITATNNSDPAVCNCNKFFIDATDMNIASEGIRISPDAVASASAADSGDPISFDMWADMGTAGDSREFTIPVYSFNSGAACPTGIHTATGGTARNIKMVVHSVKGNTSVLNVQGATTQVPVPTFTYKNDGSELATLNTGTRTAALEKTPTSLVKGNVVYQVVCLDGESGLPNVSVTSASAGGVTFGDLDDTLVKPGTYTYVIQAWDSSSTTTVDEFNDNLIAEAQFKVVVPDDFVYVTALSGEGVEAVDIDSNSQYANAYNVYVAPDSETTIYAAGSPDVGTFGIYDGTGTGKNITISNDGTVNAAITGELNVSSAMIPANLNKGMMLIRADANARTGYRGKFIVKYTAGSGPANGKLNQVLVHLYVGEAPEPTPVEPIVTPGKGVSISPSTTTYAGTVTASYSKEDYGTVYNWYRGIYNSKTKTFRDRALIKSGVITNDGELDRGVRSLVIADDALEFGAAAWNFKGLAANESVVVWAEIAGTTDESAAVTVTNKILDRGDFVYPAGQESNTTWTWTVPNVTDKGVPASTGIRLQSTLYDDNYYFDLRYRDADQALDVENAGRYKAEGVEYLGAYPLMTAQELADEQAGSYEVYVVGVYYIPGLGVTVTPADFLTGPRGTVAGYTNLLTAGANSNLNNDIFELRDDDNAADLVAGTKVTKVPALKIGTLNVGKAKYPAGAALHVDVADAGVGGFIVGTTFEVEEVNFDYFKAGVTELQDIQWYRVKDGNWEEIPGATGETYKAKPADVGYYLGAKAGHYNYNGTIQGMSHQVIAKQVVERSFTEVGKNRLAHFSNGGKFTVDLRDLLKNYGTPEGDADVTLSGNGTWLTGAKFTAADKMLTFNFRTYDTVPTTYAPYTVSTTIEFQGYTVTVKGYVMGTNDDVVKVVIEPIDNKEYDGLGVTTTAKAYVNEVEVENANIVITYEGQATSPVDARPEKAYTATASFGGASDSTSYVIDRRLLVPTEGSFSTEYIVGAPVPTFWKGQFNIVNRDSLKITNCVRKFDFDYGVSKIFYTPTMDIGGNYYIHFTVDGSGRENYYAPNPIKILVGTGKLNADPSNPGITPSTPTDKDPLDDHFVEGGVYRLFSPVTGEHLFTADFNEYKALANGKSDAAKKWMPEKAKFIKSNKDDKDAIAVYRFYNSKNGDHLYTIQKSQIAVLTADPDWVDEMNGKPAFYALKATTDTKDTVEIFRLYNAKDGQHYMSADAREIAASLADTNQAWGYDTADGKAEVYIKMIAIK